MCQHLDLMLSFESWPGRGPELLGVASTASAHYVVQKLRDEGYLAVIESEKLTPGPLFGKAPGGHGISNDLLQVLPS